MVRVMPPAPGPVGGALRRARHGLLAALAGRPWIGHALRTTAAAVLAWLAARLAPGSWSEYPYYAPLGAVVATSLTVRASTRRAGQAALAIALGAAIARVADLTPLPGLPALAVVVLAGVLVAHWRLLGDMGSWVPTSALFVLVIGGSDPLDYVSAYVGLTLLGASIGVGVNALLPPLPLTPGERALAALAEAAASHLDELAEAVTADDRPLPDPAALWAARARADAAVRETREAARANWTAARYRQWRERQAAAAARIDTAAGIAVDVGRAVHVARAVQSSRGDPVTSGVHVPVAATLDADARQHVADALRAAAALVRELPGEGPAPETTQCFADALDVLRASLATGRTADTPTRAADAVVVALAPLLTG